MKIVHKEDIVRKGIFANSSDLQQVELEVSLGVGTIHWPIGADGFYLDPESKGKKRGQGNGVKPIKQAFIEHLKNLGWQDELRVRASGVAGTGPLDAVKVTPWMGIILRRAITNNRIHALHFHSLIC